ncbi:putative T7SS-secreted protein [Streptomyces sp. UC4497]
MGVTDWVSDKVGAVKDTVVEGTKDGLEWAGDKLGMDVSERELDETVEPGELVHGSPGDLREAADHLAEFAKAFESTGQALRKIATGEWSGAAGDAFREKFDAHPKRWLTAADACHDAATALHAYADTVEWARGQAAVAVRTWRAAEQRSEHARAAYEREQQAVWDYKVAGSFGAEQGPAPKDPGAFHDPGESGRQEAREILNEARSQRTSAAATAKAKVVEASKGAPDAPGVGTQLLSAVGDYTKSGIVSTEHLLGGFIKGGSDTVRLINTVQPITPYNLTHPMQYLSNVSGLTAGLVKSTNHPVDLVKGLAGSGWSKDPVEATGTFLFDAATDVATGGAATGASAARRGLTAVARDGAEEATEAAARGAGRHAAEDFAESAGESGAKHTTDPWEAAPSEATPTPTASNPSGLPDGWTKEPPPSAGPADDLGSPADHQAADASERPNWGETDTAGPDTTAPDTPHTGSPDGTTAGDASHGRPDRVLDGARDFDEAQGIAYGKSNWGGFVDSLPAHERDALVDYSGNSYVPINQFLRGKAMGTEQVSSWINDMDSAMSRSALPEDLVVHRGTGVDHWLEEFKVDNVEELTGKVIDEKGYMSASLGPAAFGNKPAILHLRAPEGTEGIWVDGISQNAGERELLLGRGKEFHVTSVVEKGGQHHIYGEILK